MKNLIEEINEPLFKALAKNYLKLIKQRDPTSPQTLSSIQEDLARVVGYPNLHAAQAQWAKQCTPQYILENATQEERRIASKSIEWALSYLENKSHVFTRETLLNEAVELIDETASTDAEKARWKILVGEAIKEYEQDLVHVRIPGGITTKKLHAKSINMIHLALTHDPRRMLDEKFFQSVVKGKENETAIKAVCQHSAQLQILRANADDTKYACMKDLKTAYESAGFQVEVVGLSSKETKASNEIMESKGVESLGEWVEKLGFSSRKGEPHFTGPMVMLVDNADEISLQVLEAFLQETAKLPHATKVVLFSMQDKINQHSTMQVLSRELRVLALKPELVKPARSRRP